MTNSNQSDPQNPLNPANNNMNDPLNNNAFGSNGSQTNSTNPTNNSQTASNLDNIGVVETKGPEFEDNNFPNQNSNQQNSSNQNFTNNDLGNQMPPIEDKQVPIDNSNFTQTENINTGESFAPQNTNSFMAQNPEPVDNINSIPNSFDNTLDQEGPELAGYMNNAPQNESLDPSEPAIPNLADNPVVDNLQNTIENEIKQVPITDGLEDTTGIMQNNQVDSFNGQVNQEAVNSPQANTGFNVLPDQQIESSANQMVNNSSMPIDSSWPSAGAQPASNLTEGLGMTNNINNPNTSAGFASEIQTGASLNANELNTNNIPVNQPQTQNTFNNVPPMQNNNLDIVGNIPGGIPAPEVVNVQKQTPKRNIWLIVLLLIIVVGIIVFLAGVVLISLNQ